LVVSTSGGGNTLAVDEAESQSLSMPTLPLGLVAEIKTLNLAANASISNPLDLASVNAQLFEQAITFADGYDLADIYLVVFGDPVLESTDVVLRLKEKIKGSLVVAYFGGGEIEKSSRFEIQRAGVPVYPTPERAVRAIAAAVWMAQQRAQLQSSLITPACLEEQLDA
jgi:acetyltransferase